MKSRKLKWYHLYFVFAALDLIIIGSSLYLQHLTLKSFEDLLIESKVTAQKQVWIADIRSQLLDLNSYGNDVFQNKDVPKYRTGYKESYEKIQTLIQEAPSDIKTEKFKEQLDLMNNAALKIFELIQLSINAPPEKQQKQINEATSYMATMDQKQVGGMAALASIESALQEHTKNLLLDQYIILQERRKAEWMFAFFVGLAVICILYFGDRMSRTFKFQNKELESANERLSTILESAVDAIIVFDKNGKIISANKATEKIFGYKAKELLDKNIKTLISDENQNLYDKEIGAKLTQNKEKIRIIAFEIEGKHKDAKPLIIEISIKSIITNGVQMFSSVIRNITERKEAEIALKEKIAETTRANKELEHFNKIMIDRELRMIELKKEIDELKKSRPDESDNSAV